MQLLNIDQNAKTVKGQSIGYLTGVLYFAPSDLSGYQVCPMARMAQCETPCLNSAGRGAFSNVQISRINRTKFFFENRQGFFNQLIDEITKLVKKAKKLNLIPLVRLNGTSDIKYENVYFDHNGQQVTIFDVFPDVQFYDYTKIPNRRDLPKNYDLTFSYSGVMLFQKYVNKALENNLRMAVVFSDSNFPDTFLGRSIVNGDDSDVRILDPNDSIVALYAKGKAKKDTSGFVVKT